MKDRTITKHVFRDILMAAKWPFIITSVTDLLLSLFPMFQVIILANLFDAVQTADLEGAISYGIVLLLARLIYGAAEYVYSISMNAGLYEQSNSYFKVKLYSKMAKIPFIAMEDTEITQRKNRAEEAVSHEVLPAILHKQLTIAKMAVMVISVSISLAKYNVFLLITPILTMLPYYFIRKIRGKEFYIIKHQQAKSRLLSDYLVGLFRSPSSVKEMRVLGFDGYLSQKYLKVKQRVFSETQAFEKKEVLSLIVCDCIKISGYAFSIVITLCMVQGNIISLGVFGACVLALREMQDHIQDLLSEVGKLPRLFDIARDYYSIFDIDEETEESKTTGWRNSIILDSVCFTYPGAVAPAIDNASFCMKKNQSIAIVGANGSGKTTLSRLILGIYEPQYGRILYDENTRIQPYRDFSVVAQDFVEYKLTAGQNIAISRAGDEKDIGAFVANYAFEPLVEEIGGLEQLLGKEFGGKELSKGQWQQIAIARGLYKGSDLLILDEPTAALDPITEYKVLKRFLDMRNENTIVFVSHRIGLCSKVDSIIVMDQGKIVEVGSHDELIARRGTYYNMYQSQSKWYRESGNALS